MSAALSPARRLLETLHALALGLWLGVLCMTGFTAAMLFPTMKALNPTLPQFSAYTGEHWRIAAGSIAQRLFLACDTVGLACGILSILTLGLSLFSLRKLGRTSVALPAVRVAAVSLAGALLGYQLFMLGPEMGRNLARYYAAAQSGDMAAAATHQAAFAAQHPTATTVMGSLAACTLIALLAGLWHATAGPAPALPTRSSTYEEPALLRAR